MTAAYLGAFVVGAVALLSALLLADVGADGGPHAGPADGLPFLSLTSLSAGVLGAGTGGLIATWAGASAPDAGAVAAAAAVALIAVLNGVLLPYLRRQQANSHRGRASYVGLLGTVTLDVPVDGWGEVSFVDADGTRVRARARTAEPAPLPKATPVYIADVDNDFVHVVAVPDL
ncbi:hypothetical protein E4P42_24770 [Mycobacterium sp. PS03-16]|uniref:hypothetical protein n=1 Tax=Mycobacterium sp. PS03-16 TaxID=2559611 RepID=UPI001073258C|nr:hypothetical protein [Mycobacterium sp. PS03-16]TFV54860.1 hypothetical protein E4P42_24770 [Mycobacterium sp. PS03-16]